jgi:hypothetical protein
MPSWPFLNARILQTSLRSNALFVLQQKQAVLLTVMTPVFLSIHRFSTLPAMKKANPAKHIPIETRYCHQCRFVKLFISVPPQCFSAIRWYRRYSPNHMTKTPTHQRAMGKRRKVRRFSRVFRRLIRASSSFMISSSICEPSYPPAIRLSEAVLGREADSPLGVAPPTTNFDPSSWICSARNSAARSTLAYASSTSRRSLFTR